MKRESIDRFENAVLLLVWFVGIPLVVWQAVWP